MRPFWQALWETHVRKNSPKYCTGNHPNHMYLLNYTRDFIAAYRNVSKFAFMFGSELTHWDNNPGEYMDQDLVDFFEFLRNGGFLKDMFVIVFADHGARYSRVRKTIQGKVEERLPFMSIAVPDWFKHRHKQLYRNLVRNSDKLATPFDIHKTLVHILNIESHTPLQLSSKNSLPRAINLLDPVPAYRTCSLAHIQVHWCTCLTQIELDSSDIHVQKSINALLAFLNNVTQPVRHLCAQLKFQSLHYAALLIPNEKVNL